MKHTKGSWVAYENISEFKTGYVGVETDDGDRIYEREVYKSTYENEFANAALIAAAPELLEALKSLCDWFDGETRESAHSRIDTALAAIAKAEGL